MLHGNVLLYKSNKIGLSCSMSKRWKMNAKFPNKIIPQFTVHSIIFKVVYTFQICDQEISDYYLLNVMPCRLSLKTEAAGSSEATVMIYQST
jgi:hypothetical protein